MGFLVVKTGSDFSQGRSHWADGAREKLITTIQYIAWRKDAKKRAPLARRG
jgi:hypothetical protein